MGIARVMSLEWDPQELAGQLLQVMGGFMRDVAVMHKVLEGFYEHLDEKHKWQDKAAVQVRHRRRSLSVWQRQCAVQAPLGGQQGFACCLGFLHANGSEAAKTTTVTRTHFKPI
eukprot:GHRR01028255.1.p1 GENE.GHRR01028255.1~~GHRR01028255.1.p1  ORF type:complete len:114 (+),score=26.82 GHRR01028255.1:1098-1439(+)